MWSNSANGITGVQDCTHNSDFYSSSFFDVKTTFSLPNWRYMITGRYQKHLMRALRSSHLKLLKEKRKKEKKRDNLENNVPKHFQTPVTAAASNGAIQFFCDDQFPP